MEFWGIEIKPGEPVKCSPGEATYLHLSQASLGPIKKDKNTENVTVFVNVDGQKLVIGTLSGEKCPQISLDLVFEKDLALSHSSKTATVYFIGYKAHDDAAFSSGLEDSEEEAVELTGMPNGKPDSIVGMKAAKLESGVGEGSSKKPKVKADDSKTGKSQQVESDSDDEDSDADEDDEDSDDEPMAISGSDDEDDEDDDSSDEEDEATPKKADITKKRAADSASKTPVPEKKAKLVSPDGSQKTGAGKKSVHTATPYPTKKVAKTPANTDKPKPQTPKSGGSAVSCKSCSKTFNSDGALQSHTKAKHEAK